MPIYTDIDQIHVNMHNSFSTSQRSEGHITPQEKGRWDDLNRNHQDSLGTSHGMPKAYRLDCFIHYQWHPTAGFH